MDLTYLALELLDGLPANRTLGLTVTEAVDGAGRAVLPVTFGIQNVIGALHSSGVAGLVDAAALAAVLSTAPDEALARQLQPLGVQARLTFHRPARGNAVGVCVLDDDARSALAGLYERREELARFTTHATIEGHGDPKAATGEFDWVVRLSSR